MPVFASYGTIWQQDESQQRALLKTNLELTAQHSFKDVGRGYQNDFVG